MNRRFFLLSTALPLAACAWASPAIRVSASQLVAQNTPGASGPFKTIIDEENYFRGPLGAYCAPFYRFYDKTFKRGVDYQDEMVIDEARFPANTVIRWQWPDSPPKSHTGVYGYMHVYRGNYSGGKTPEKIPSRQIRSVKTFHQIVDFTILSGDGDGFDVLNEFFLTSEPDDHKKRVFEIGFILHTNARTIQFTERNDQVGTWTDAQGHAWSVAKTKGATSYITFCTADHRDFTGEIDVKAALDFLIVEYVLTGEEWINGIAIGVEPHFGNGELTLNDWKVTLE